MWTFKRTSLPLLLILLGIFACAVPVTTQVDQNSAGTAVAQTLAVIIQQTQDAGQSVVDISSDTPAPSSTVGPTETFTPIPPTFTPSLTPTPTFTFTPTLTPVPTLTFTPLVPMLSVSVPTNCRLGPGKPYDQVGALMTGVWVQVYGRAPAADYWYIRNPDHPSQFCWVWGEYATVTGSMMGIPIYTPPPSPTPTMTATPAPSFDASYLGLETCADKWWADIKLKNTGSATFRSVSMTLRDTVTTTVVSYVRDGFINWTGCDTSTKDTLLAGKSLTASSPKFNYEPGGHKIKATITLCSQTGLNGMCVTETITFTP